MTDVEKRDIQMQEYRKASLEELEQVPTVDTVHQDEALKVLAQYAGDQAWSPEEEKKLTRKVDRKLIALLYVTCGLQYYDKAMLPALFGLWTDLQLEVGDRYSFSASIFYLGSIVGSYPAVLMAQRFPIEKVASAIFPVWGVCLMCSAACTNWQGYYAQRFFLGFLESGISPMFMLVVGGWYKRQEQALRMVSPLINYGLGQISGGGLNRWQYMYLVAGAITILWAVVIYFFMPSDLICAKGFTDTERYIAVLRTRANNFGVRNTHFKAEQLWESLLDIKFWLIFATAFVMMIANGPVSSFIPIIISGFGYDRLNSLLLTLPASPPCDTCAPYLAYRVPRIRTWIIAICQLGTVLASLLLWLLPRGAEGGFLFACYILASFGGGYAVLMGLQIANTGTPNDLPNYAPVYPPGFTAVLITSIVAAALTIVYRYICIYENKRRDKTSAEGFENAFEDDLTDKKNPQFRYTI
ncbi:MFS transporter [Karstenula rhodostoma CBS 690.94]|uniref:MFS transporter n=1 Tax=Karstenula rhodostoma CBS 690.94 TaxID=1392251 RepID=A0A9P4PD28_9PLEO|nr:MFS transporter [Karstenula rhodostoma CBS 690.94]